MITTDNLNNLGLSLISGEDATGLNSKYTNIQGINVYEYYNTDNISLENGVYDVNIEDDTTDMVAIQDTFIYEKADESSSHVGELKVDDSITVTSVEVNGFVLLNGNIDRWVKKEHISTKLEANKYKNGSALLIIENPDINYNGGVINITGAERDLLERLVMGEAGAEGYEGACLVAQTIRDFMLYKGYDSVEAVRKGCGYSGSLKREPNTNVKKAVAFIFDEGGYAIRHQVYFFYAFKHTKSSWHETQEFLIQHNGHRFFDYR